MASEKTKGLQSDIFIILSYSSYNKWIWCWSTEIAKKVTLASWSHEIYYQYKWQLQVTNANLVLVFLSHRASAVGKYYKNNVYTLNSTFIQHCILS